MIMEKPLQGIAIELYLRLTEKERKEFANWLSSRWCNSNKQLTQIYRFVEDNYSAISNGKINKGQLFSSIYPHGIYNDKLLRNLLGFFAIQLRKYLVVSRVLKFSRVFKKILLLEYMEKELVERFSKSSQKLLREIASKPVNSWEDMLDRLLINEQLYFSPYTNFRQKKHAVPLEEAQVALDDFYFLGKLRLLNEEIEREKKFEQQGGKNDLTQRLSWLNDKDKERISKNPLISLYYQRILQQYLPLEEQFDKMNHSFRTKARSSPNQGSKDSFSVSLE